MKKKTEPGKPVRGEEAPKFRKKNTAGSHPGKGPKKRFDALDRFHKVYGSAETPAPDSEARSKRTSRPAADKDRPARPGGGTVRKDAGSRPSRPAKDNEGGGFRDKKAYGEKPAFDKDKHRSPARDTESRDYSEKKPYGGKRAFGKGEERASTRNTESRDSGEKKPYSRKQTFDKGEERSPDRNTESRDYGEKKPFDKGKERSPEKPGRYSAGKPSDKHDDRPARPARSARPSGSASPGRSSGSAGPERPAKPGGTRFNSDRYQNRFERERPNYQSVGNTEADDEENAAPATGPMPLNKFIAHSGECSRRDAAALVKQGKVRVNGELILEPGHKVTFDDKVTLGGKKLTPQKGLVYILMNKPKGFITTTDDPAGRRTVMELVSNAGVERVFPVGRLDRNTTGLLLLTNDGDLAQKLSHPKHKIKKIYQVTLDKAITKADFDKIVNGVELEDGVAPVDSLAYLDEKNEVGIEIHSGRNRIVRRIFESLGYDVTKLDRVMYAGLTKKNLPRGKWRFLSEREVILLRHFKN